MINKQMPLASELPVLFINRAKLIPINIIGLPARALKITTNYDAKNSYDAISIILQKLSTASGIGTKTIAESQEAICKFIAYVESATEDEIKILIDPRKEYLVSADGNVVDAFPKIIDLYLSNSGQRSLDILNKRFGLNGGKRYTLEDIGTYYDLTRERVRQIEAKCIKDISLLLKGQRVQKEWKICSKLQSSYISICEKIDKFEWIVLRSDVDQIFQSFCGDALDPKFLDLFMEVSGYQKLPRNIAGFRGSISESWCASASYNKNQIESIFQALDVIYDTPSSTPLFELIISAKKKLKSNKTISNESIKIALAATNDIDFDGENVTVKFSRLRSVADKALRILESHNKPIHFSKIIQEMNLLGKHLGSPSQVKETSLTSQLAADKRFTPIGRSGEWALTTWNNLNNITIIQAIEKVLHASGEPLSFTDIKNGVEKLRPDASPKSLKVYLNNQPLFTRVGKSEFALTAWRIKAAPKNKKRATVSKQEFNKILKSILIKRNPISFPDLISEIEAVSGLKAVSIRQKVLSTTSLSIYKEAGNRFKTITCSDLNILSEEENKKVLLRDKVKLEIRAILFDNPNTPYKKGDLYKEVRKSLQCTRPSFYHYLQEMDDIEQFNNGNDYFALYRHEEAVERIELNIDKYTSDEQTKELLKRPLSLLTVENVDIALFELGLIFENTLKKYLLQEKNKGEFTVNTKDVSKLANMVDCVVREGVVTKGHHLSTLREERNNRAHGETPNFQERRELFNKAHYISELFIQYICFFAHKYNSCPYVT